MSVTWNHTYIHTYIHTYTHRDAGTGGGPGGAAAPLAFCWEGQGGQKCPLSIINII